MAEQVYAVSFWNLENLFDVEDSLQRPDWLRHALRKELVGWDAAVLDRKLDQLAHIIGQLNQGRGPDVLGVCEVENQPVLEALVAKLAPLGRDYRVAHHDTSDQRGIDIAFLYDHALLRAEMQFNHVILKRTATRDLFQVNFRTHHDNLLMLVGNHWPSRSGGQYESEPYRMTAGETLSYWAQRILEIHGPDAAVVFMGDFNDEPFNRSVTEYALAGNSIAKVMNTTSAPRLYNLMWRFHGAGIGTHYYNNFPNLLDQFWVSRGLVRQSGTWRAALDSATIDRFPEMTRTGDYPGPRRFSRPSANDYDPTGFSDHFPISMQLIERV